MPGVRVEGGCLMPIIHMCHDLAHLPADAVNVRDVSDAYRNQVSGSKRDGETQDEADARARAAYTLWLYDSHVGLCLQDGERNGRDDSDFYMTVWNPETQAPETIEFASTRGWSYPCYGSKPDATPEVLAAYAAYKQAADDKARQEREAQLAAMPTKGKALRVVKGRKIPPGTVGQCFWSDTAIKRDSVFGILFLGYRGRVGIDTPTHGRVFVNVENVEVVAD